MRIALFALAAIALALWESRPPRKKSVTIEECDAVTITKVDGMVVGLRGGFDDVMAALDPRRKNEKPPLPDDLDISTLKSYEGGCPHCRQRSLFGEGTWRYRILSCTRERWDNTTTYLARCKNCQGLMKSTVDHND